MKINTVNSVTPTPMSTATSPLIAWTIIVVGG